VHPTFTTNLFLTDTPQSENADWSPNELLDLNLHHPIKCTQLAIDHFSCVDSINPCGVVVLVSRIVSPEIARDFPDYAAAKSALNRYVRSMADEKHPDSIRCVAVAPKDPCERLRGFEWKPQHRRTKSSRERSAVDVMVAAVLNPIYIDGTILEVP
jgi:NAD(P)-dependent dehydrogenase (short-subunit alcohol dehydrogenase family)